MIWQKREGRAIDFHKFPLQEELVNKHMTEVIIELISQVRM